MKIDVPDNVLLDNLYIKIVLGREFFEKAIHRFGKQGFNQYCQKLRRTHTWAMYSTPEPTEDDEFCMPTCVEIDLQGCSFVNSDMSGLDLTVPTLEKCNFAGACLDESIIGSAREALFTGASLRRTQFAGDITGCDFTAARHLDEVSFSEAWFHPQRPPIGVRQDDLDLCCKYPEHWALEEEKEPSKDNLPAHKLRPMSVSLNSFWGELQVRPR